MTLLLALCMPANAYDVLTTPDGHVLSWDRVPIPYRIADDSIPSHLSGATRAIETALAEWTLYDTGVEAFSYEGRTPARSAAPGDDNAVFFEEAWPWGRDVLALAVTWTAPTGEIAGFDLRINGSPDVQWSLDGREGTYDLQATLTHEAGHVLGLSHSDVGAATMSATLRTGKTGKRSLHADDIAGVNHLYPQPIAETASPTGCSHVGSSPFLLSGLWFPLLLIRRRQT